jgi:class 3 adenylate cyclase/tetratricopeptide (TPR) repeat protein
MFADLSGYTALNEATDPEEVETLMARIKADATAIVERLGGTVTQFVGDEIMAIFGVPVARRDDARRAVTAALELHRAVDDFVATLAPGAARSLRMHTGINAGLVVARRSDGRAGDFALTGDAVNTAARLRGLAAPGEIVVSEAIWRQVADVFEGEVGPAIEVKGKEQPLVGVRIRGVRETPASEGPPLVGRDEELREFRAVAEACAERKRGRVVVVRGDPGVGKSRLVAEFGAIGASLGLACHTAAVLDFGSETGRDAVRSLARSLLGVAPTAGEDERRSAVARVAHERALTADQRLFLHDLLDVAPPADLRALAAAMSTAARERGSIDALCALAASAAATVPLLVVVEDIHWADAWTLDRLAALAMHAARQPVVLVLTTRFAGDPTAGAWRASLHGVPLLGIDLAPLGSDDAKRLAELASAVPPKLLASCAARAEGNPLSLLQLLLEVAETVEASLPGSIQAHVHTRMDRLAGADKGALQAAAVLGQRFALDALRHLLAQPAYDCRVLVEQFLVRPDGSELLFCHALIRDGAYASLLHARRRELHRRAGEWFAARETALAAEHFERAGDARAAAAYLDAARALAAQFRLPAALALVERGIGAATDDTRFELLMERGRLLAELGRSSEAIEACATALAAAASPAERARALIAQAAGMRLNDRLDEGLAALDEAEPLARAAALPRELSRLHHLRGNLLFPLARNLECLREHVRARRHARSARSSDDEAAALGGLGDAYYLQGRMRSANVRFRKCVELARATGNGRIEVANLPMVAVTELHLARTGAASKIARDAVELASTAAQPRAEMIARTIALWVEGLVRGDRDTAERHAEATLALVSLLGAHRFEAQVRACVAVMAARAGDSAAALALADAAVATCRRHGMSHVGAFALGARALAEPDPDERRRWLRESEAQLLAGAVSHNHLWLREIAIEAALDIADWDAVDDACERLCDYTAREPLPYWSQVIARGRALARHGRGDRSPALRAEIERLRDEAAAGDMHVAAARLARPFAAPA